MSSELIVDADLLARDCDTLRKSLSKGSINLILVPEMLKRLHRIIEAADTLSRLHPEDVPTY